MAKADAVGGTAPAPPTRRRISPTGRRVGPPPDRPRAEPHPGTRASRPPGTRASRPQPYFWLEVVERQRNVAGRQPPCRRERHWPVRMKGKAPLPFHPSGGVGQGCAGQMCGRDARVPGGPSSTQQTGNMIYITPRNRAGRRLQASRITPPLRGSRRGRAEWRRPIRWGELRRRYLPAAESHLRGAALPPHRIDCGRSPTRERGRPAPRERGRLARNLISGWRWWSVSARLPAGSHPAGVNRIGQSE